MDTWKKALANNNSIWKSCFFLIFLTFQLSSHCTVWQKGKKK